MRPARDYQVSRRTASERAGFVHLQRGAGMPVRSALTSAWPAPRELMLPRPSKLDAFGPVIGDNLRANVNAAPQAAAHRQAIYGQRSPGEDYGEQGLITAG